MDLNTIYQGYGNDLLVPDYSQKGFDVSLPLATNTAQGVVHSSPFDWLSGGDLYETESTLVEKFVMLFLDDDGRNGLFWRPLPH